MTPSIFYQLKIASEALKQHLATSRSASNKTEQRNAAYDALAAYCYCCGLTGSSFDQIREPYQPASRGGGAEAVERIFESIERHIERQQGRGGLDPIPPDVLTRAYALVRNEVDAADPAVKLLVKLDGIPLTPEAQRTLEERLKGAVLDQLAKLDTRGDLVAEPLSVSRGPGLNDLGGGTAGMVVRDRSGGRF